VAAPRRPPGPETAHPAGARQTEITSRLAAEHRRMRPELDHIRSAAAALGAVRAGPERF
jgi:hypothetical protein